MAVYQGGGQPIVTVVGTETLAVNNGFAPITTVTTAQVANFASVNTTITTLSTVGAGTITAAGVAGRIVSRTGSQSGSAFTDTTGTAAAIIAARSGAAIGSNWEFVYQNNTNAPATITGGTGVTVSGITVVPANTSARFLVTYTAANTVTVVGFQAGVTTTNNGTFTCNGATAVTVTNAAVTATSSIVITLMTVGGTVGAIPSIKTITPGTGFTISGTAGDTSVYRYLILE